MLALAATSN